MQKVIKIFIQCLLWTRHSSKHLELSYFLLEAILWGRYTHYPFLQMLGCDSISLLPRVVWPGCREGRSTPRQPEPCDLCSHRNAAHLSPAAQEPVSKGSGGQTAMGGRTWGGPGDGYWLQMALWLKRIKVSWAVRRTISATGSGRCFIRKSFRGKWQLLAHEDFIVTYESMNLLGFAQLKLLFQEYFVLYRCVNGPWVPVPKIRLDLFGKDSWGVFASYPGLSAENGKVV